MTSNETSSNCSSDSPFSEHSQIFLLFLCSLCFLSAVGGNILVLLSVYRTRSLQNCSMYFLASLSAADLMVGLFMTILYIVIIATYDVQLSDTFWAIFLYAENFTWVATLTASTLSLSAVSIDRYIAVLYSLRYRELVTTHRCVVSIIFLWVFSLVFASSLFICGDNGNAKRIFWVVCFSLVVGIPFIVILFCNFKLTLAARRQVRLIHDRSVRSVDIDKETSRFRSTAKNRKATITAIIISTIFFALFFPQLVVFIILLVTDDHCYIMKLQIVWFWAAIVSFCHSAVNPWIYCIRSREFRKAMKKQLCPV